MYILFTILDNFDESFVMAPLNLNGNQFKTNNFKNKQNNQQTKAHANLGQY